MSSLSVITPVFNEEDIILDSINKTFKSCSLLLEDVEYIIVNDGSTDNSLGIIQDNFSHLNFKIINKRNGGFGSAIKAGIDASTKDYVLCVPADSPLDLKTAQTIVNTIGLADITVTYRKERKGYSKFMLLNSIVYQFLISKLFSLKLNDYNWIHLYNKKIFCKIEIEAKGIFSLAEVLIKANRNNYSFFEVEVEQQQRLTGIATASKPMAVLKTIIEMFQLYFKK